MLKKAGVPARELKGVLWSAGTWTPVGISAADCHRQHVQYLEDKTGAHTGRAESGAGHSMSS